MKIMIIILLSASLYAGTAKGQTKPGIYTLTGNIDGFTSQTGFVYMKNTTAGNKKVDSVPLKDGKFVFTGNLLYPVPVKIYVNKIGSIKSENAFTAFIEPGELMLTGKYNQENDKFLPETKLTGSPTNVDFIGFTTKLNGAAAIKAYQESVLAKGWDASRKLYPAFAKEKEDLALAFINAHPKSFYSLYLLKDDVVGTTGGEKAQQYGHLYAQLDPQVRGSALGKSSEQRMITMARNLPVGAKAVEFSQPNLIGRPVKLSDYKGKYIFLDFWASWCAPCRAENPNVVKAYEKFKAKGFDVLSISLDDNVEKWKTAIAEDQLPWLQVSDLQRPNATANAYGVLGIPDNFLIDPNGVIIAKGLRGKELIDTLSKVFKEK